MYVHGAGVAKVVKAPNLVQQLVSCVYPVGREARWNKSSSSLGGVSTRVPFSPARTSQVYLQLIKVASSPRLFVSSKRRITAWILARSSFTQRLCDVVVGAHFKAGDFVHSLSLGCQHDYGYSGGLSYLPADLPAVFPRQHDVQQNQLRSKLFTISRRMPSEAMATQNRLFPDTVGQLCNISVVLHYKGFSRHEPSSRIFIYLL